MDRKNFAKFLQSFCKVFAKFLKTSQIIISPFSHITPRKVFLSVLRSFLMNVYFVYSLMNVHKVDMDHSSTAFKGPSTFDFRIF